MYTVIMHIYSFQMQDLREAKMATWYFKIGAYELQGTSKVLDSFGVALCNFSLMMNVSEPHLI